MQNKSLIFKKVPTGTPKAGEHLVIENRPYDPQASAPDNGLSIHNIFLSFDPYQRGRMRDVKVESYSPAYKLDEPIKNSAIAKVIHSNDARFEEGDLITRYMSGDFEEYSVLQADDLVSDVWKLDNPFELDPSYFLGPLGMPGLTAYSSFYEIAQPVKGETMYVYQWAKGNSNHVVATWSLTLGQTHSFTHGRLFPRRLLTLLPVTF